MEWPYFGADNAWRYISIHLRRLNEKGIPVSLCICFVEEIYKASIIGKNYLPISMNVNLLPASVNQHDENYKQ
jgi:hypothetical protein